MKGSPMYRNYSIGKAPAKQMSKPMDPPVKQFEEGDYYDTRSKAPLKDYDMEKGSHDHPHSPAKNMKDGKYKHDFESPAKQKVKTTKATKTLKDEGGDTHNEKGQSQQDVIDGRKKSIKTLTKSVKKGTKQLQKAVNKGMNLKEANKERMILVNNLNNAIEKHNISSDSIKVEIPKIIKQRKVQRSVDAEVEYRKKSSNKMEGSPLEMQDASPLEQKKMMESYRKFRRNRATKGAERLHGKANANITKGEGMISDYNSSAEAYNNTHEATDGSVGIGKKWSKDLDKQKKKISRLGKKVTRQAKRGNKKIVTAGRFNEKLKDKHGYR